jgi:Holliday junction DNA helicase RuvA
MPHQEFARALEANDAGRLSKVPGLGLKTAQKIILALQGKLLLLDETLPGGNPLGELIASLAEMGFDRRDVEKVVQELGNDPELGKLSVAERERTMFQRALFSLSAG